jgi:hypothetical protein
VVFFVATIAIALVVVVVTKGSFHRLARVELHAVWLLLVALAVQVVLEFVDFPDDRVDDLGLAILLASYALILGFCFMNRRTSGMLLIALGVGLNVLVIALNGGMPTKDGVEERNGREVRVPIERTVKHKPRTDDDRLDFLGDVITIPGAPNQQFSVGDIVIGIGVVYLCFVASRPPRTRGEDRSDGRRATTT